MRPRRARSVWIACALGLFAAGCGGEEAAPLPVVRPVKILEIGGAAASTDAEYPGEVSTIQSANLAFEVAGRIVEFPVSEGQRLAKGALIARLDPRDFEAELAKGRAALANARTEYERFKYLYEQNVASKQIYEQKLRNYQVIQASFAQIEKATEDAALRAPFDGVVARKLLGDFANVQAKEAVVLFQDESQLQVVVSISEQDFLRGSREIDLEEVNRRIRPRVVLTAAPDREHPARITEVSTSADPTTRTFRVTLSFDPPEDLNVRSGMTARVVVTRAGRADGLAQRIPAAALLADAEGTPTVWRIDPATMSVSRLAVQVGEPVGDEIEIRGGLPAGTWIAVSGVHQLQDGMTVRRWEP